MQEKPADLLEYCGKINVIVVDYYSKYFELASLQKNTCLEHVINQMKSIFSGRCTPKPVVFDSSPLYVAVIIPNFLRSW